MTTGDSHEGCDVSRRRFIGAASAAVAALHPGKPALAHAVAAHASDQIVPTFGPLRQIDAGELNIGYVELGPAHGHPVLLLHGWPYDIHSYAAVAPTLAAKGYRVIVPYLRGFGTTRFRSADAIRNGQQAALAMDAVELMNALRLKKTLLAGFDWGARAANAVAALWPERCSGMVSVSGYLIGNREAGRMPLSPRAELSWWYQFYFATERGRAGYAANRHEFARLIWTLGSPEWRFDAATFERSARALDNPDHVDIVIHNYRWRIGAAQGESNYEDIEAQLASTPSISTPTITLEGDRNGAPHPDSTAYARKFTGWYQHRLITGGIGHNLPQEAPHAFVEAVVDIDGVRR